LDRTRKYVSSKNTEKKERKRGTHTDALEHVDNVVDPPPLHAEAPGGVVQPDALHIVPVVQGHEAARYPENSVSKETRISRNVAGPRAGDPTHLEQRRPSDFCLRL
jgi:hypothetical protein